MVTIGAGSATPDERVGVRRRLRPDPGGPHRSRRGFQRFAVDRGRAWLGGVANSSSARASSCGSVISIRPTAVPASARRYSSVPAPPEDSDARKYHAGDRHPAARHPRRSGVAVRLVGRLRRRSTSGPTRRFRVCRPHRKWSESSGGSGREPAKMVRCEPRDLFADHPAERTAIVTGGDRITYGQLSAEVEKTRGVLVSLGLEPGDRVAILWRHQLSFRSRLVRHPRCGDGRRAAQPAESGSRDRA